MVQRLGYVVPDLYWLYIWLLQFNTLTSLLCAHFSMVNGFCVIEWGWFCNWAWTNSHKNAFFKTILGYNFQKSEHEKKAIGHKRNRQFKTLVSHSFKVQKFSPKNLFQTSNLIDSHAIWVLNSYMTKTLLNIPNWLDGNQTSLKFSTA
jgi:hypothetical protein